MDNRDIYHSPSANLDAWNRTLCSVLDEMRTCYRTRNFAPIKGLIEEAQTYGNRMEAKLSDVREYENLKKEYRKLKEEVAKLEEKSGISSKSLRSWGRVSRLLGRG